MVELIYNTPKDYEINGVTLSLHPTGNPNDRGEIVLITNDNYEIARAWFSPAAARELANKLIEFADKAERLSTRGFSGSKE